MKYVGPSGAINVVGDVNVVGFLFHGENHGKQLQIVKSQHDQISRFAIVSHDFHREKENPPHLRHPPHLWHHWGRNDKTYDIKRKRKRSKKRETKLKR